jgi:hypothetical protein
MGFLTLPRAAKPLGIPVPVRDHGTVGQDGQRRARPRRPTCQAARLAAKAAFPERVASDMVSKKSD